MKTGLVTAGEMRINEVTEVVCSQADIEECAAFLAGRRIQDKHTEGPSPFSLL